MHLMLAYTLEVMPDHVLLEADSAIRLQGLHLAASAVLLGGR